MKISLRYDMRLPDPEFPPHIVYQTALEQCAWADALGFHAVYIGEHHGAEDGYIPSSIVLASAVASRTKRLELHLSALLLTMHHPIRLAEDLAVLDIISNGRVAITAGVGYRPHEFDMMGVDFKTRMKTYLGTLELIQKAWAGQPVEYQGHTFRVTPTPVQKPGIKIYIGGSGEKQAQRAAQMGFGFRPGTPELYETYREEWRKAGRGEAAPFAFAKPIFLFVTENPDKAWEMLAPHILYTTNSYVKWASERKGGATTYQATDDVADLKANPLYQVVTPKQCVEFARSLGPDGEMVFQPLFGGIEPKVAWTSLKLFESDVLPVFRKEGLAR